MSTEHTPRTFSQFVASGLQLRPSQAITIPAPTTSVGAIESERMLSSALRRDTVRAVAPHTEAVLADLECTW